MGKYCEAVHGGIGSIMEGRLIFYDTSNYIDFPVGGQLTSVRNFLRFLVEEKKEFCSRVMLVGITTKKSELGTVKTVIINGVSFYMLPVAVAETDLSNTVHSLRLQFAKGLLKYGKKLSISGKDCNYIHTPEAYGVVKLLRCSAKCVIFSHGSYFNMERGFRFFQKNIFIKKGFMIYIKWILRNARMIFVLDDDSERAYSHYNKNLIKVRNSIICGEYKPKTELTDMLLFVGRLSKDKRIQPIIEAVNRMDDKRLIIVGDGEEYTTLKAFESAKICFKGAVLPEQVAEYMKQADVLIMNSAFEGVPMTILEAISFGVPVVTTPVGGIPQVLSFGVDSEETDGSPEQIKTKIEKIYKNYISYSQNAYEKSKAFDYKTVNRKVFDCIEKVFED